MALTPDDVVTKQFQLVRFKEGFDPEEVDDFLDAVVVEWRKTIKENEELKEKLAAYESGEAPATDAAEAEAEESAPVEAVEIDEVDEVVADAPSSDTGSVTTSAGIIELAQRLHDEHVAQGKAKAAELIAEAEAKVADAEVRAKGIVDEAEGRARDERQRLENDRVSIESRIGELRDFERDYRSQLRSFIEEKLQDLDITGTDSAATGTTPIQN